jgi:hypothetical protein
MLENTKCTGFLEILESNGAWRHEEIEADIHFLPTSADDEPPLPLVFAA